MGEKVEDLEVAQTDFNIVSQHLSTLQKATSFIAYVPFKLLHGVCFAMSKSYTNTIY